MESVVELIYRDNSLWKSCLTFQTNTIPDITSITCSITSHIIWRKFTGIVDIYVDIYVLLICLAYVQYRVFVLWPNNCIQSDWKAFDTKPLLAGWTWFGVKVRGLWHLRFGNIFSNVFVVPGVCMFAQPYYSCRCNQPNVSSWGRFIPRDSPNNVSAHVKRH